LPQLVAQLGMHLGNHGAGRIGRFPLFVGGLHG
jgi:hypothetical protein